MPLFLLTAQVYELALEEFTLGEAQPAVRDIRVHRWGRVPAVPPAPVSTGNVHTVVRALGLHELQLLACAQLWRFRAPTRSWLPNPHCCAGAAAEAGA